MPLEETVDSLEGISEEHRDLYVAQEDGKFKIDISGLKSAVQKERQLRSKLERQLKKEPDPDEDALRAELDKANNTIKQMKVGSKVKEAALKAGVAPDVIDDVLVLTKQSFTLDDSGSVVVLDADGEPSGKGLEKFFNQDFKKSKPRYYANTGRKGSGAQSNLQGGGPLSREGQIQEAAARKDTRSLVNLLQTKVNKK